MTWFGCEYEESFVWYDIIPLLRPSHTLSELSVSDVAIYFQIVFFCFWINNWPRFEAFSLCQIQCCKCRLPFSHTKRMCKGRDGIRLLCDWITKWVRRHCIFLKHFAATHYTYMVEVEWSRRNIFEINSMCRLISARCCFICLRLQLQHSMLYAKFTVFSSIIIRWRHSK